MASGPIPASSDSPGPSSYPLMGPLTTLCKIFSASQGLPATWTPPPPPAPPRAVLPWQEALLQAPPPWVTDCDKVLLPVSGNSFPVSPLFHLSGAPGPSPPPQHWAPSCLPGSWLPSLFLRQHSLKISAASLLSAEKRLPHYSDTLMSLAPRHALFS